MTALETADQLARRFHDAVVEHQPVEATAMGDHRRDEDLPDLSAAAVDAWVRTVSELHADVEAARRALPADPTGDDREAAGDLELLALRLEGERFWLDERRVLETDPLAALGTVSSGIHELLRRTDLPAERQAQLVASAVSRARSIPRFVEQAGMLLSSSPRPHLEVALGRVQGLVALVRDELPRRAEELGLDPVEARDAGEVATEALGAYGALLSELGEQEPADWRLGPEAHAKALRFALGSDMAVDVVERRARAWLAEVREQMAEDAGAFLAGTGAEVPRDPVARIQAALDLVSADRVDRAGLLDAAREAVRTGHRWAEEAGFVDLPPAELLSIREVPPFLQGVAVAFISAPPALEPESGCTYYLSPVPDSWDDDRARSFLSEYNRTTLLNVALHEAVPGHWVQLEHAARHPRFVRRWLFSSAFAEGWAVHIERVAVRLGFGDDLPEVEASSGGPQRPIDGAAYRLSQRKLELRLATNALLDVGLHAGDLDDDAALSMLTSEAFQQQAEAAGKLTRGKVTSGQLCSYFVGGEELRDIEEAERRRAGAAFDLHRFHQKVLSHGTPTPATVRAALADPTGTVERRPFARSGSGVPAQ